MSLSTSTFPSLVSRDIIFYFGNSFNCYFMMIIAEILSAFFFGSEGNVPLFRVASGIAFVFGLLPFMLFSLFVAEQVMGSKEIGLERNNAANLFNLIGTLLKLTAATMTGCRSNSEMSLIQFTFIWLLVSSYLAIVLVEFFSEIPFSSFSL